MVQLLKRIFINTIHNKYKYLLVLARFGGGVCCWGRPPPHPTQYAQPATTSTKRRTTNQIFFQKLLKLNHMHWILNKTGEILVDLSNTACVPNLYRDVVLILHFCTELRYGLYQNIGWMNGAHIFAAYVIKSYRKFIYELCSFREKKILQIVPNLFYFPLLSA